MDETEKPYNNNEHKTDIGNRCFPAQTVNSIKTNLVKDEKVVPFENIDCKFEKTLSCPLTTEKNESSTQIEKRQLGKRKRRIASLSPVCPVCGLTLRYGDINDHYEKEVKLLNEFDDPNSKRSIKWLKKLNTSQHKKAKYSGNPEKSDDQDTEELTRLQNSKRRQETYTKIKNERRLRYAKLLLLGAPHQPHFDESSSEDHIVKCPICNMQIEGNEEELTHHVQRCLSKQDGEVDLEDSDEESIEEYTWAGQTRIRATSLLEGGLGSCGGDPIKLQMTNEDEELDIDGDIQSEFGLPQYTEKDVIPCNADIPTEAEAQDKIRAAISVDQESGHSWDPSTSRWSSENGSCCEMKSPIEPKTSEGISNLVSADSVADLKKRIVNLTDELQKEKLKCLICMEGFSTPLVSVICWHVYCEECWLRTLGAKKLCPQCNTITSPGDLRRIFI